MSREIDVPVFLPPGMPWFVVAIAGALMFVGSGSAPPPEGSEQRAEGSVQAVRFVDDGTSSAGEPEWQESVKETAELFRRFLGKAPKAGPSAEDSKRVLALPLIQQLDGLNDYDTRQAQRGRATAREDLLTLKLAVQNRANVRVLLATIADYHDSNGRWRADEELATIQSAAGAAGYSLLDFYLPDWQAGAASTQPQRRRHEREPGALLFRKDPAPPDRPRPDLLLALLVPETPTAGVHGAVFKTAVRFARDWSTAGPVQVVGPKFSGSILSVRSAFQDVAFEDDGDLVAHVVSGMATSSKNRRLLKEATLPPGSKGTLQIDYWTTVHHDEDLLRVLHTQLVRINQHWESGNGIALLVEANTGWGTNLTRQTEPGVIVDKCRGRKSLNIDSFPCATLLSFPLHVSRLGDMTGGSQSRRGNSPSLPAWAQGLRGDAPALTDTITPTDALPFFTPNTTSTVVGTMLHDVLEALARGEYGAVGIFATDIRDHLFLAREINRVAPNVLRFGVDPHMLMLHPDYQPYVRGTLMASSYPTHARVQRLTSAAGDTSVTQFASMGAQGMYNAMLTLLKPWEPRHGGSGEQARPLDYSGPWILKGAQPTAGPVPWVVVVGREGFSPLAVGETVDTDTIAVANGAHPQSPPRGYLLDSWHTGLLWALPPVLLAACLARLVAPPRTAGRWFHVFAVDQDRSPEQRIEHRMLTLGCALPIALGLAWLLRLWQTLSTELSDYGLLSFAFKVGCLVSLFIAAFIAIALVLTAGLRVREAMTRTRWAWPEITSFAAVLIALAMSVFLDSYLTDQTIWTGASRVFHVERTMAVSSLISPAPALAALLSLAFAWAFWGLRSLHHHVIELRARPTLAGLLEGNGKGDQAEHGLALCAQSTVHPAGALGVLPLAVVGVALLLVAPHTHSVDGAALGWVVTLGSMLGLVALSIELGQAAWLGRRVKDALEHLRGHALGPVIEDLGTEHADWGMSLEPRHGKTRRLIGDKLQALRQRLIVFQQELKVVDVAPFERPDSERRNAPSEPATHLWHRATARRVDIRAADISGVARDLKLDDASLSIDDMLLASPREALVRTPLWRLAMSVAERLATPLEKRFWGPRRPVPTYTVPGRFLKDAERFVAIVVAVIVRTLVVRVVRGLSIAALLGAVLLFAHLTYTFPGRRFWLLLDLAALTLAAVISVRQLLVFERDHILSRLWSSQPGRVGLNSGLLLRAIATSALPVLTFLAVLFPEVGGGLLTWIEPLRHLVPTP